MNRPESGEKPLQSWKEIAAYFERDIRTANRWEKEAGLPVRRYTDGKRSSVYAYPRDMAIGGYCCAQHSLFRSVWAVD